MLLFLKKKSNNYMSFKILVLLFSFILAGCVDRQNQFSKYENLIAIKGRDTTNIALLISGEQFFGNYEVHGRGGYFIQGQISGDVKGDTLLGSLYYTPYKWKDKKRKAFALLKKDTVYIQGHGSEYIYMNIPHYKRETVSFNGLVYKLGNKK